MTPNGDTRASTGPCECCSYAATASGVSTGPARPQRCKYATPQATCKAHTQPLVRPQGRRLRRKCHSSRPKHANLASELHACLHATLGGQCRRGGGGDGWTKRVRGQPICECRESVLRYNTDEEIRGRRYSPAWHTRSQNKHNRGR